MVNNSFATIRWVFILIFAFLLFPQIIYAANTTNKQNKKPEAVEINKIVAIVNDDVITQTELNNKMRMAVKQLNRSNTPQPSTKTLRRNILQQLIDQQLQLQLAANTGIRVSSNEISEALKRIAKQNKMTIAELYQSVQEEGWTIKEFRQQMRDDLTMQKLQERDIGSRISISSQEVNDALQTAINHSQALPEYHIADILISLPETPSPQQVDKALNKAKKLMGKLKAGTDFNKLATAESAAEESLKGGDLGWRKLVELPDAFAKKTQNLKVGQIAGPIRTANGFHIIKLLAKHDKALKNTYEEAEVQIIFLRKTPTEPGEILLPKVSKIRKEIITGTLFTDAAKKYSEDKDTASQGGYAGWVEPQKFDPVIDIAIKKLKVGEISRPILTKEGYYLIKVIAKRRVAKSTAAEKSEIEQMIYMRKLNEGIHALINRLRNEGYIKIL